MANYIPTVEQQRRRIEGFRRWLATGRRAKRKGGQIDYRQVYRRGKVAKVRG